MSDITFSGQPPLTDDAEQDLFGDLAPDQAPDETPEEPVAEPEVESPTEAPEPSAEEPSTPEEGAAPDVVVEGGEPEPAAEPSSEAPDPLQEAIKRAEIAEKRFADLRRQEMASLESERARRELAEQTLASKIAEMQQAKLSPEKMAELVKRAEEQGLDPQTVGLFSDITSQTVDARTHAYQELLQANAQAEQQVIQERQQAAERALVAEWSESKEGLTIEQQTGMKRFLHDIAVSEYVDQLGNPLPADLPFETKEATGLARTFEPVSTDMLDIAYEAVTNPALGEVLRALPDLYESEDGMKLARSLASRVPTATTQPAPPSPSDVDARLAKAATLGGPSAPAPPSEEELFIKPSSEVVFSK